MTTDVKNGSNVLKAGLKLYNKMYDNMQEALGLKKYGDQLQEMSTIMGAISKELKPDELANVQVVKEAYELSVKGTNKATLVVSTIYQQAKILALVLDKGFDVSDQQKIFGACATFARYTRDIDPLIDEAITALQAADSKLVDAKISLGNIVTALKRVNTAYLDDLRSAEKARREKNYGLAALGALLGPFGLFLTLGITAGVTEGHSIPDMEKSFTATQTRIQGYIDHFKDMSPTVESVKTNLEANRKELFDIESQLSAVTTVAGEDDLIAAMPIVYLPLIRTTVVQLRDQSKAYLTKLSAPA